MSPLQDCFQQVYRMALAAWQSHTFWLYTRHDEPLNEDVQKEYWNFFYATHEAHLTMMIISLDCLYEKKKPKLYNFETLLELLCEQIDPETYAGLKLRLKKLQTKAKGIQIIRNNSFGHITGWDMRVPAGEKHGPTRLDLLTLCCNAIRLARDVGVILQDKHTVTPIEDIQAKDIEDIQRIFKKLKTDQKIPL